MHTLYRDIAAAPDDRLFDGKAVGAGWFGPSGIHRRLAADEDAA